MHLTRITLQARWALWLMLYLNIGVPMTHAATGPLVQCGQGDATSSTGVLPGCRAPDESIDAGANVLGTVLPYLINWFVGILGVLAVLYIIWSGAQFISSMGSEDKAKKAQKAMLGVLIGLLIAMSSYVIISIVTRISFPT